MRASAAAGADERRQVRWLDPGNGPRRWSPGTTSLAGPLLPRCCSLAWRITTGGIGEDGVAASMRERWSWPWAAWWLRSLAWRMISWAVLALPFCGCRDYRRKSGLYLERMRCAATGGCHHGVVCGRGDHPGSGGRFDRVRLGRGPPLSSSTKAATSFAALTGWSRIVIQPLHTMNVVM